MWSAVDLSDGRIVGWSSSRLVVHDDTLNTLIILSAVDQSASRIVLQSDGRPVVHDQNFIGKACMLSTCRTVGQSDGLTWPYL